MLSNLVDSVFVLKSTKIAGNSELSHFGTGVFCVEIDGIGHFVDTTVLVSLPRCYYSYLLRGVVVSETDNY